MRKRECNECGNYIYGDNLETKTLCDECLDKINEWEDEQKRLMEEKELARIEYAKERHYQKTGIIEMEYIGSDGALGLKKGNTYKIKHRPNHYIGQHLIMIEIVNPPVYGVLRIPYSSLGHFLDNWERI